MKQRVLIVEDEEYVRTLLRENLEAEGLEVVCASTGKEALDLAKKNHLDLAVIDIGLPDITGFDVCKGLQADYRTSNVPLVILSAQKENKYRKEMKDLGLKNFFSKPYDPVALGRYLKELLPVAG
ncbi:MAG: response regulator [Elusimicrobia bacterium]|nr:response regulator [Elusimicrobiota bacterium]